MAWISRSTVRSPPDLSSTGQGVQLFLVSHTVTGNLSKFCPGSLTPFYVTKLFLGGFTSLASSEFSFGAFSHRGLTTPRLYVVPVWRNRVVEGDPSDLSLVQVVLGRAFLQDFVREVLGAVLVKSPTDERDVSSFGVVV